jgi:glycosyltransferase involved in cell wall biosynthesis
MTKKILVLAPLPPPIGGISQLGNFIVSNIQNAQIHDTKVPSFLRKKPYSTTKNIISRDGYILISLQLFYLFFDFIIFSFKITKFNCIHIISSTGPGLYRNILYSLMAKLFCKNQIFHLVGDIENHTKNINKIHKKIIFYYLKFISPLVVQSEKHKIFFCGKGIDSKVIKNPSLLNSNYQQNKYYIDKKSITILIVGIFGERKGYYRIIKYVLSNFEFLTKHNIKFEFVGNGDEYETLKLAIDSNELSRIITINNNMNDIDLKNLYAKSSLFLLPTSSDGMPLVIIDAISYGIPVIGTNVGCISDVIVDDNLLIKDLTNWQICLEYFLSLNENQIKIISNNTFDLFKSEYSQKVFIEKISLEYES